MLHHLCESFYQRVSNNFIPPLEIKKEQLKKPTNNPGQQDNITVQALDCVVDNTTRLLQIWEMLTGCLTIFLEFNWTIRTTMNRLINKYV